MKYYVTDYRIQKNGEFVGMAVAGPFDSREEANREHTRLRIDGSLTCGPDDLGPEWENNKRLWKNGDFI